MRDGDWFCKICNFVVYRPKKRCLKCRSFKPGYKEKYQKILKEVSIEANKLLQKEYQERKEKYVKENLYYGQMCRCGQIRYDCWKCGP